jgi:hypothetical protein
MIFKGSVQQAHGSRGAFVPGFGVSIADAVQASCSAFPMLRHRSIWTASSVGETRRLGRYARRSVVLGMTPILWNADEEPNGEAG